LPSSEQRAEVGVGRHEHAILRGGLGEDDFIISVLKSVVADVESVVTGLAERLGDEGRQPLSTRISRCG
jgi:hypothetical protein